MATKRMFSRDITSSDAFLDMPSSSQSLYFHLGMEADDDGFIGNPKKVMRVMGVGDDDLKILFAKRFLLNFPSGVVVVKHHRINNNWDKYNCKRTVYIEEFSQLRIKENKAYTLDETQGTPVQSENSLKTVFRIEENRIDKTSESLRARGIEITDSPEEKEERPKKPVILSDKLFREVCSLFSPDCFNLYRLDTTQRTAAKVLLTEKGMDLMRAAMDYVDAHKNEQYFPKVLTPDALLKNWLKLVDKIENYAN